MSRIVAPAMPVFVASLVRVALGALVLAPFAWRQREALRAIGRRDWALLGTIAVVGMFGFSVLMLLGMRRVPGVVGATVMSTTPAITAAAAMLLLGDRATWRKLVAVGLAVGGVVLLHLGSSGAPGSDGRETLIGSALVLGAVCCEAAYTLLGKRVMERVDPMVAAALAAGLAVPLFVPLAVWEWPRVAAGTTDVRVWVALAWYGAGTLGLGSWLWYSGLARVEGTIAAGFMGVMPVSALVLSYVLLDEPFRWVHLAGFAVVFAGVLLISWEHAHPER